MKQAGRFALKVAPYAAGAAGAYAGYNVDTSLRAESIFNAIKYTKYALSAASTARRLESELGLSAKKNPSSARRTGLKTISGGYSFYNCKS